MAREVRLVCCTANNNNKSYRMVESADGTSFTAYWGRVGGPEASKSYPIKDWEPIYREKTTKVRNGYIYKDMTHLYAESTVSSNGSTTVGEILKSDRDPTVKQMVERLLALAKTSIKQNYTVSSESVTQKQVDEAQKLLNEISKLKITDIPAINKALLEFFQVVPRKMKQVKDHLIPEDGGDYKKLFQDVIVNEQNTLDVMAGQVATQAQAKPETKTQKQIQQDLLDQAGLDMEPVTDKKEIELIKQKMGPKAKMFKSAFKVKNRTTREKYLNQLASAENKMNDLFWHGSRSENWWSIINKGLLIRPTGAAYSGSAFGDGVYFANEFDKSLGYTSIASSRWAGGNQNIAFLALYRVHLGKQYVVQSSDSSLSLDRLKKLGNYDSTHAKKGGYLVRDEFIVYQPVQADIEYLVEVEGSQYS